MTKLMFCGFSMAAFRAPLERTRKPRKDIAENDRLYGWQYVCNETDSVQG